MNEGLASEGAERPQRWGELSSVSRREHGLGRLTDDSSPRHHLLAWKAAALALAATMLLAGCATRTTKRFDSRNTENRAIESAKAYLTTEVRNWREKNGCFSCHNNGDAARILMQVTPNSERASLAPALRETVAWLQTPQRWSENKGDPAFSDLKLARIQFGATLLAAIRAGFIADRKPLLETARQIARDQDADGSWKIEAPKTAGSPVTYGNALATLQASRILIAAKPHSIDFTGIQEFELQLKKADAWLSSLEIVNVPAAAAVIQHVGSVVNHPAQEQLERAIDFILAAQSTATGGWGPYPGAPPEPFDTGLALAALAAWPAPRAEFERPVERGRAYLLATQLESGGWPETTRPPNGSSYAQHISTSAWACQGLVASCSFPLVW